ncbi:MAG: hydrogenase maturation protease [Deltaproteobacteria bacterium]|nr:hydrogenase maturation protease [Deltaproteobacteria bacterium]
MRIVVLGLGNPVLADDAVGLEVAERVEALLASGFAPAGVEIEVCRNESGGWDVLDYVEDADALVLVDASTDSTLAPGELRWYDPRALACFTSGRLRGVHNIDMFTAIDYARRMGTRVPAAIHVLGIGVEDVLTLTEECTPRVREAVEPAARRVLECLGRLAGGRGAADVPERG